MPVQVNTHNALWISGCTLLAILANGCTTRLTEPVAVERDYGNSVEQMRIAQIYDPVAASRPDVRPPKYIDGTKTEKVIEVYRRDISKPVEIKNEIHINVGK